MDERHISFQNSRELLLSGILNPGATVVDSRPWVILSHGMLSSKDSQKHGELAKALERKGYNIFRFDFSGQGESQGRPELITFSDQIDDLNSAIDTCIRIGARSFILCGSSMGSAVSALVGEQRSDVAALALMATLPTTTLIWDAMSEEEKRLWHISGFMKHGDRQISYAIAEDAHKHDVGKALANFAGPLLAVHGAKDEIIPPAMAEKALKERKAATRFEIIPGADHRFSRDEDRKKLIDMMSEWINETARGL